jgi:hypothetical protein
MYKYVCRKYIFVCRKYKNISSYIRLFIFCLKALIDEFRPLILTIAYHLTLILSKLGIERFTGDFFWLNQNIKALVEQRSKIKVIQIKK